MGLLHRLRASQATPPVEAAPAASTPDMGVTGSNPSRPTYDRALEGTNEFVRHIENGACHWQQPDPHGTEWPINGVTERPYHGFNVLHLAQRGYADPRWCTFEQAAAKGWRVNKGERGTSIFFWKVFEKETGKFDPDSGDAITRKFPLLCRFKVFNFSQIAGPEPYVARVLSEADARKLADPIVEAIGVDVRETNSATPGYDPAEDALYVKPRIAYGTEKHYYADLLNGVLAVAAKEAITHLALPDDQEMTPKHHAQRELRVEMARSMLSMRSGLPLAAPSPIKDAGVIELLTEDKREVFRAAKDAERIMRYALAFNPEILPVLEEEHRNQMDAATNAGAPGMVFDANEFDFWPDDGHAPRP